MGLNKFFWIKLAITIIVLIASFWYLYPTYKLNAMSDSEEEQMQIDNPEGYTKLKDKEINLGLDLQGGLHLVLEVDTSTLTAEEAKDAPDRALEVIRNRVDQYGVSEPTITKGEGGRIIVQMPGVKDIERAKKLLQGTAQLTFQMLTPPDKLGEFFPQVDKILAAEGYKGPEEGGATTDKLKDVLQGAESDSSGQTDSTAVAQTDSSAAADTSAVDDLTDQPFTSRLARIGGDVGVTSDNYEWVKKIMDRPDIQALVPAGNLILWGPEEAGKGEGFVGKKVRPFYFVQRKVELTGEGLEDAIVRFNDMDPQNAGKPYVEMTFNRKSQRIFADVTGEHVKERLAIVLDTIVQSAPVIQERINSPSSRITGDFNTDDAKDLAIVLRAGALPAPLRIMEERTVGPSLGQDSITHGVWSTMVGGILVIIFMIVWYKASGVIAIFALGLNIILVLASLAMFGATLTLPGIAGIILTMATAVDANVLIYERIREEIRNKKTVRAAIDVGYARAFWTIFDSNLTVLITSLVLFQFGTGPIKGFAVTLCLGLIISVFTAVVVSRLVFDFVTNRWTLKTLSI